MKDVLQFLKKRHSDRRLYDPQRPIKKEDLHQILEAGSWASTAHNMQNFQVVVVDDRQLLETIGGLKYMVSRNFLRENYQQLSFSEEELRQKKTGLLSKRFSETFLNPESAPKDLVYEGLGKAIASSAALLVVLYNPNHRAPDSEGDFFGIISLGCVMENMWLMAEALGISCHIVSFLGNPSVAPEVKKILGIPGELKIAYSCRMGYPVEGPAGTDAFRVRRDVEDFTSYNCFGSEKN